MVWIRRAALFCFLVVVSMAVVAAEDPPIRFSLPPVLEALPVAFALEWDLFEAHGVSVELIGITDNQQRSAALMTGNLDGMMEDVTRSILESTTGGDIVITSASTSRPQTGSLSLALLSPESFRLDSIDALLASNYAIATIYRSDFEYLLEQLLADYQQDDAPPAKTMYFHDMLQMAVWFGAQTLPAAVLPEPYISYLQSYYPAGGQPIGLVIHDDFSNRCTLPSVTIFRTAFVEQHPDTVAAFYAAYVETIERINAMPRDELVELGIDIALSLFFQGAERTTISQAVLDTIEIPYFDVPDVLERSDYDGIRAWMLKKGYVYEAPTYDEITDFQFVR